METQLQEAERKVKENQDLISQEADKEINQQDKVLLKHCCSRGTVLRKEVARLKTDLLKDGSIYKCHLDVTNPEPSFVRVIKKTKTQLHYTILEKYAPECILKERNIWSVSPVENSDSVVIKISNTQARSRWTEWNHEPAEFLQFVTGTIVDGVLVDLQTGRKLL